MDDFFFDFPSSWSSPPPPPPGYSPKQSPALARPSCIKKIHFQKSPLHLKEQPSRSYFPLYSFWYNQRICTAIDGKPTVVFDWVDFCPRKPEQEWQRSIGNMVNYCTYMYMYTYIYSSANKHSAESVFLDTANRRSIGRMGIYIICIMYTYVNVYRVQCTVL